MRTRSVAAGAVGALLASVLAMTNGGGASAAPTPSAPQAVAAAYVAPPIAWDRCDDPGLRSGGARCGTLVVPLDWSAPDGATIRLAVSRVKHTSTRFRGAVFTNPGGPGGSGLGLSTYGQYVPRGVGLTYDWYGMDPRGVGASRPALTCDGSYNTWDRPDYNAIDPRTGTKDFRLLRFWRAKASGYATSCANAPAAALLPHLKTTDNVQDFEALRQAIGQSEITFYGFSYGTYIAQVYATLYPDSIKAIVMDGVVNPERVYYRSNLDQDRGFQITVEKFFAWVAQHHRVYRLGRTQRQVYATYRDLRARLTRRPADGKIGPSELDDAVLPAGYYNLTWLQVGDALSRLANRGEAGGIKRLYRGSSPVGPGADNGFAIYLATQCTDAPWPDRAETYLADNTRVAKTAPFYTWGNGWFNFPCQSWAAADGPAVEVSGAALRAPVLLTSETLDAATPYSGALAVRRLFPTSRLVAGIGGTSHAVTLYGVACTDNAVADLLATGDLPSRKDGTRADRRCDPLAPPDPTGASRTAPRRPLPTLVPR